MRARCQALTAVVLLSLTAGGCAESRIDAANEYVRSVNAAREGFAAASERLVAELTPGERTRADRRALETFQASAGQFTQRLRRIEAPTRVRALHERLVAAASRFEGRVRSAAQAILADSPVRVLDGQQQLARATAALSRSVNATVESINTALKQ